MTRLTILRNLPIWVALLSFARLAASASGIQVFEVGDLKPGMKGEGLTVFEGGRIEKFGVEVLGVLPNYIGPKQDLIIARLSGARLDFTGVVAGMSGSPVYFDGKLAGAVSYRLGSFAKEPLAGITPARYMIEAAEISAEPQHAPGSAERRQPRSDFLSASITPIETPVSFSGFPAEVIDHYATRLEVAGMLPVAGGGAQRDVSKARADAPEPGAPLAGQLIKGDLSAAATGTVTAVMGDSVIAFGHPFLQAGSLRMPMASATIIVTLPSQVNSVKLAAIGDTIGELTGDRNTAVFGRIGSAAPTLKVNASVTDDAGRKQPFSYEIFVHKDWTPNFFEMSLASVIYEDLRYEPGGTVLSITRLTLGRGGSLELSDSFSGFDGKSLVYHTAGELGKIVDLIMKNPFADGAISSVEIDLGTSSRRTDAALTAAWPEKTVVKPGETLRIFYKIEPYRKDGIVDSLSMRLPDELAKGDLEMIVADGRSADAYFERSAGQPVPDSLDALLEMLRRARKADSVHAILVSKQSALRYGSDTLDFVPPSVREKLDDNRSEKAVKVVYMSKAAEASKKTAFTLSGQVTFKIEVKQRD